MTLSSGYLIRMLWGMATTLQVALATVAVGAVLGICVGALKVYGGRWSRYVAETYTAIVRGVPDLIVIYLIYFGSTVALTKLTGTYVDVNGFAAGVAALSFIFGAYAGDIFRGAIRQVPAGQSEAALVLGLPPIIRFTRIILPQAWRIALPGFGNLAITMFKQTSLISVIGLEELLRSSQVVAGATREPFVVYSIASVFYLVLTTGATLGLWQARAAANRGNR